MGATGFGSRSTASEVLAGHSLTGKTAIVTGASSGIGVETARALAAAGADVVMAVRNVSAGEQVAAALRASLPATAGRLEVWPMDLADLTSVGAFAQRYLATDRPLHLLICNAGIMAVPEGKTPQGHELQVGTNHLGHMALTLALQPRLAASAPARVVVVSSAMHKQGDPARLIASLQGQPIAYAPMPVYGDAKLANVLFAKALTTRLPQGVTAYALHPGVIGTNLSRDMGFQGKVFRFFIAIFRPFMKSAAQGAATTIYAAVAPELDGTPGAYLADCAITPPAPAATDAALAEQVWNLSLAAIARTLPELR